MKWIGRWTRCFVGLLVLLLSLRGAEGETASATGDSQAVIVVGFVGGFVRADDERHPEVRMMERIAQSGPNVHAVMFRNGSTKKARQQILRWLDTDGDGRVSEEEKRGARIILLGHSWGGAAVVQLANRLDVPILLTIQLDSVNKPGGNDCRIPPNVARAMNLYQTHSLAHGCQRLELVDPQRTQVVANLRFDYTRQPAACSSFSWLDRHFLKAHNAMGCDPQVWDLVEREIRRQMQDAARVGQAPDGVEADRSGSVEER